MKLLVDISEEYYELLQKMPDDEMTGTMYAIKYAEKPCEDAISRQAAIEAILTEYTDCERKSMYSFTAVAIKQTCADLLSNLPPVIPSRPTGHWIDTADEINAKYGKHDYKCSKCGKYAERFIAGTEDWWSCVKPNYCPNCGAYMVESEEQA